MIVRRLAVLASSLLVVAGTATATAVAEPVPQVTDSAGTYVALPTPTRVVDTRTGAAGNHKGSVGAGHSIRPMIAGRGGLPSGGIGAVVATVTVYAPTGAGSLVVDATRVTGPASLAFARGQTVSNTVTTPLSGGHLMITNAAHHGRVQIAVDVAGYYRAGSPVTTAGGFVPVATRRVVDTRTGAGGNRKGALSHGHGSTATIAGHGGVPSSGVGAVAVNITVLDPTRTGTLLVWAYGQPQPSLPAVRFTAGRAVTAFDVVPLGSGKIKIFDAGSAGSVQVLVDVRGYYRSGPAQSVGAYQPLPTASRVYARTVGARHTVSIATGGHGGVPVAHLSAVLVALHAVAPSRSGALQAWRAGAKQPRGVTVEFGAGHSMAGVALVPVSGGGHFDLRNSARTGTRVDIDVLGYVPANAIIAPATSVGRYVRDLGGSNDVATMTAQGAADARIGSRFVLLEVGAQANDKKGVVLSGTNVEISYAHLVTALDGYLAGYAAHQRVSNATIAVGTNNDANDWTHYPASQRGKDFADKVIDSLTVPAGITLEGADDVEAAFFSTQAQAQQWENAYLAATSHGLIYNGDANDCPTRFGGTHATCAYGWTEAQYYALAHHGSRITVLPQIYGPGEAVKWANIDATGGGGLIFAGALTEHAAAPHNSQAPGPGWAALYRAISSLTSSPRIPAAVDLEIDG